MPDWPLASHWLFRLMGCCGLSWACSDWWDVVAWPEPVQIDGMLWPDLNLFRLMGCCGLSWACSDWWDVVACPELVQIDGMLWPVLSLFRLMGCCGLSWACSDWWDVVACPEPVQIDGMLWPVLDLFRLMGCSGLTWACPDPEQFLAPYARLTFGFPLTVQIDGTFRINTPSVLLGYTYDLGQASEDDTSAPIGQKEDITYLSIFITIEPPLIQPEPMRERVSVLLAVMCFWTGVCVCVCVFACVCECMCVRTVLICTNQKRFQQKQTMSYLKINCSALTLWLHLSVHPLVCAINEYMA